ncbi:MAG: glutaredoxin family protein [Anaerolineae bacterium]
MVSVKLYTLSTCPWCKKVKRFLDEHNVVYSCVDYDLADSDEQQRIQAEIKAYTGNGVSFPYAVIGDVVVMGYNPERYSELLGIKG